MERGEVLGGRSAFKTVRKRSVYKSIAEHAAVVVAV